MKCGDKAGAEVGGGCLDFISKNRLQVLQASVDRVHRDGNSGRGIVPSPDMLPSQSDQVGASIPLFGLPEADRGLF